MNYVKNFLRNKANKELSSNIILTLLIKGGAMLISLLILPAYVKYFSNDTAYGAWVTVSSVFTWITMFDFGIGNGLRNHLVKTIAAKDEEGSRRYISSAYLSVGGISLIIWAIGAVVIQILDWNSFLKVAESIVSPVVFKTYIQIVFAGVVIHFFFLLAFSICYAIQKTFLPSLITLLTQVILLLFILIPNSAPLESKILQLSGVYLAAYNIPILVLTLVLFRGKMKSMRPSLKAFDKSSSRDIINLGGKFFVIQLALIALSSSQEIYINLLFNADDVVQYHYYHKLFYVIIVMITLVQQPIWSAVTKAFYEKRYKWIKKVWSFMLLVAVASVIICVLLALMYQPVADIWLGKGTLNVDTFTLIMFVIMTAETLVINTANSFANGFGILNSQAVCTVLGAVIKLPIALLVGHLVGNWSAVILASVIAQIPLLIVQPILVHRYVRSLAPEKIENQ